MRHYLWVLLIITFILSSCTAPAAGPGSTPVLRVMAHDSFAISSELVSEFEQEQHARLEFIKGGDAGAVLNKALLTRDNLLADVLFGVDNSFLSRALENDLFEVYTSPVLQSIPAELLLDGSNRALPVDYGDVCINYDKAFFAERNLALPQSLDDLMLPAYRGMLVTENPASSSPGLAFMLATIDRYGEDGYLDYWQKLRENGIIVVNDWSTAYYNNFSASSGKGPQPMVVSYNTSPVAEVVYADPPVATAPTGVLAAEGMCYRQVEFIGILKGTPQRRLAEAFVDFMLSKAVQEDIPLQMFMLPANRDAVLPAVFTDNLTATLDPAMVDTALIAQKREQWLQDWAAVALP